MTDAEAMDLLVGRAFQTEGEAVGKIIRAKQTSCQLSTYFVGRTAFYRLRQQLQRELGDRFDLARFHEAVLVARNDPREVLARARAQVARNARSRLQGEFGPVSRAAAVRMSVRGSPAPARVPDRQVSFLRCVRRDHECL